MLGKQLGFTVSLVAGPIVGLLGLYLSRPKREQPA